jgi:hypothetical protein
MALDQGIDELTERFNRHEAMDVAELAQLALDLANMAGLFTRFQERVMVRIADKVKENR